MPHWIERHLGHLFLSLYIVVPLIGIILWPKDWMLFLAAPGYLLATFIFGAILYGGGMLWRKVRRLFTEQAPTPS